MKNAAIIFKALGDATRLQIVQMLFHKELCVCDILDAFTISQPAISHHLAILRQAEIVLVRKEGKWVFYRLNPLVFGNLQDFAESLAVGCQNIEHCNPQSLHQLKNTR